VLSTTASYLSITSNMTRGQATAAADPTVKNDTAYYLANIGKVKTASDFVKNYRLFSYAMKAYGLSDMTYAKGLMTQLLNQGTTSSTALANKMSDARYKAFATAFNFADLGSSATATAAATSDTTAKYLEQTIEDTEGKTNTGVQLALYFKRTASSVTSAYGILADAALLKVVQTTFGISPYSGNADIDAQASYLNKVLNIKDLQDPSKVEKLVERFTAMWDASGNNTDSTTSSALLVSDSSSFGLSSDLLMSIAGLKLGG
jgi:Protein of unknown function (DUF1217)